MNSFMNVPTHCWPSPEYPWLQLQVNEPAVLLQEASEWQSWVLSLHSFLSVVTAERYKCYFYSFYFIFEFFLHYGIFFPHRMVKHLNT